ncbi:MAG: pyridoxal-phosphate dependent enzyme [Peptococcaceae bacterium]|jgi:1-aminocyclopropane-1-carboxylate deaminase/D-cysteine desulfhydrase-like pyridoxal-dependent ACC family enzyme|nr:pyridoxal-phosphate dependent enzyme [Peptococcaceae bacterium]
MDIFAGLPRVPLLFSPTPLHRADNLSGDLGISLWLKRDDLTGPGAFGGNKMRKLEFLLGQAKAAGADYVFTFGATQSNHAMQTAAACGRCGLKAVLYLVAVVEPDAADLRGNMLLDALFGAETHIVHLQAGETEDDGNQRALLLARKQIAELTAQGHRCVEIPIGGANPVGSLGFAAGYLEVQGQLKSMGEPPFDYLYHSTGSAGTLAGLLAGQALAGGGEKIMAVCASPKILDTYTALALGLGRETLDCLWQAVGSAKDNKGEKDGKNQKDEKGAGLPAAPPPIRENGFAILTDFVGPGYEIPTPESTAALRTLARREGVTLDPVYSAKAFAGLLRHVQTGRIAPGARVLFWHTGGSASLFAEPAIVGDLR